MNFLAGLLMIFGVVVGLVEFIEGGVKGAIVGVSAMLAFCTGALLLGLLDLGRRLERLDPEMRRLEREAARRQAKIMLSKIRKEMNQAEDEAS